MPERIQEPGEKENICRPKMKETKSQKERACGNKRQHSPFLLLVPDDIVFLFLFRMQSAKGRERWVPVERRPKGNE